MALREIVQFPRRRLGRIKSVQMARDASHHETPLVFHMPPPFLMGLINMGVHYRACVELQIAHPFRTYFYITILIIYCQ